MKGLFITLEGIEGCGKTTQLRLLSEHLEQRGAGVTVTREPGGTPLAEALRGLLLDPATGGISPLSELMMYAAARAQHVDAVIRPALERGGVVLCDRFCDSTLAYQGGGRGICMDEIRTLNALATGGLAPDLTLLFDLPVEEGLARALQRIAGRDGGAREDRFEREHLDFHRRIREGYLAVARQEPGRVKILDASRDIESTRQEVRSIHSAFLGG
ncbi:MAG TPA: dTMP kinase [Candidatus Hydrogenedentes bacterium]|nr:dTMP kinase [Candidatus Hydrogenedentota bacterium]